MVDTRSINIGTIFKEIVKDEELEEEDVSLTIVTSNRKDNNNSE